jgi:hypothetical protein
MNNQNQEGPSDGNNNNAHDPRQLELFPGFKARPTLAKCRELDELEQLERLETISAGPFNERLWECDHE